MNRFLEILFGTTDVELLVRLAKLAGAGFLVAVLCGLLGLGVIALASLVLRRHLDSEEEQP